MPKTSRTQPGLRFGPPPDGLPGAAEWQVRFSARDCEDCYGATFYDSRVLYVAPALDGKTVLGTALHEALHAEFYDLSEEAVLRTERHLVELLWWLGFRLTQPPEALKRARQKLKARSNP